METISLTQRQQNALWIVREHGPVTVSDLEYHHLNGDYAACHGMLARLEARGLVQRTYTGHHRSNGRSAYAITRDGEQAVSDYAPEEDE